MNEALFDAAGCVNRVRSGDEAAARELVDRTYPLVAKIVRAYLPRDADRAACEQDVYLRVFERIETFRADAPLEHWLSRIAVNVCLDALRARKRRRELRMSDLGEREAEAVAAAIGSRGESGPEAVAARETVDKILECLEPEDAVLVRMLDIEERSVKEAAELLGRSVTSVKVRAFRARRKLRTVVERMMREEQR